ncbi:AAA family ATPase (plasmid) [Runella sp. SP2]|nr:AAA family ATPase [Runella sp. SP2]
MPLNSILYGPPGTGKTFYSITHAVAIVENKTPEVIGSEDRKDVKARFDQYIREGQIVFCTFHQSMGYEDFIEGIKPVEPTTENEELSYAVEDGIFKKLCVEAAFSFVQQKPTAETKEIVDFSTQYDLYINFLHECFSEVDSIDLMTKSGGKIYIKNISPNNNIHVSHKESSKSYTISKTRLSKLSHAFPNLNKIENINDEFRAVIGGSNSSAYWAVLNGFRKYNSEHPRGTVKEITDKRFSYDEKAEIIEALTEEDYKVETPKNFVIIIDEINRGNVSQIFGELITLIEDDKRLGKDESLTALLPYSKKRFGVPPNVYIIGTMNTADRSVEALDTALRRRFAFIPKMPEETKLQPTEDGINLAAMLTSINNRLKVLKDADHTIGHAWLWNVKTIKDLQAVFGNKILPLLQEYFYNDFEKLGLVLGDNFFQQSQPISSTIFASFSGGNGLASQYDQTWQYQLKKPHELTVADFQSLYLSNNRKVNESQ